VDAEALEFAKTRCPDVGSGLVCRCSHALTDPNVLQFITVVVGLTTKQFVGHSAWQNPINHPGPKMTIISKLIVPFCLISIRFVSKYHNYP
jgi:hypothetical protein